MRGLLCSLAAVWLGGCATPPATEPRDVVETVPPQDIALPDTAFESSGLALSNGADGWLAPGDRLDQAQQLFPAPRGAKRVGDLPPMLKPAQFKVWGWQTKGGDSFGVILDRRSARIALAMSIRKRLGESDVSTLVKIATAKYRASPTLVGDGPIRIYSWGVDRGQQAMLCAVTNKNGGYTVSVIVGVTELMKAVGADSQNANRLVNDGMQILGPQPREKSPGIQTNVRAPTSV